MTLEVVDEPDVSLATDRLIREFFNELSPLRGSSDSCKTFAASTALAEVCDFRVLPVYSDTTTLSFPRDYSYAPSNTVDVHIALKNFVNVCQFVYVVITPRAS